MKTTNLLRSVLIASAMMSNSSGVLAQSQWSLTGNAGTNSSTNFLGTTDNVALKIRTNNFERATMTGSGNFGIGNSSPLYRLDVSGSINTDSIYRIGGTPALSTQGFGNTLVGLTLHTTNTGTQNTFIGSYAGQLNSTGTSNSFLGYAAGSGTTIGTDNTFVGQVAGYANGSGSYNTYLGKATGYFGTTSIANTFIGYAAGYASSGSGGNSFLGYRCGQNNGSGHANTFMGGYAGYSNSTGSNIVAFGDSALFSNATSGNTAVGSKSGYSNTSGYANSFFGQSSGYFNTGGTYNSFFGRDAGYSDSSGTSNSFFGAEAGYSCKTASDNTFMGMYSGYIATGAGNSFYGKGSGAYVTNGTYNTFLGYSAGGSSSGSLTNATAIGANAAVTASNCMVLGNGVKVGIGISAPVVKLQIVGGTDVAASGGGFIQLGASNTTNIAIDDNEIMARSNGSVAPLYLNQDGGIVVVNGTNSAGSLCIGTNTPASGYALSVNGKAICTEMRVELKANWPDYVFSKDHQLMPLNELEKQINDEQHLPGIPSAKQLKEQGGVDVGAMQTKMMEKIEELTLYVIQLKKDNDSLKNKVEAIAKN